MAAELVTEGSRISTVLTGVSIASIFGAIVWHQIRLKTLPMDPHESGTLLSAKHLSPGESNLGDEFTCTADGQSPNNWKVKSLWIFPLKSCRGIELKESRVVSTGLEYDRQYTLAEWKMDQKLGREGWVFVSQRQYPLMARVTTAIKTWRGSAVLQVGYPVQRRLSRLLSMWDEVMETFEIPLDVDDKILEQYQLEDVRIWKEVVSAHNMGKLLPPGLAQSFGAKHKIALFRLPPSKPREVFRCAPRKDQLGYQPITAFADAYPLHMLNIASVRELNSRLKESIPTLSALRFRSNIIISGPSAFMEDDWKCIKIGQHIYHTVCRTVRCNLPNVDQETGERHPAEPSKTMKKYRCIDPGNKLNACMGMQVVPACEDGIIRVGDLVTVLETGDHYYIDQ